MRFCSCVVGLWLADQRPRLVRREHLVVVPIRVFRVLAAAFSRSCLVKLRVNCCLRTDCAEFLRLRDQPLQDVGVGVCKPGLTRPLFVFPRIDNGDWTLELIGLQRLSAWQMTLLDWHESRLGGARWALVRNDQRVVGGMRELSIGILSGSRMALGR